MRTNFFVFLLLFACLASSCSNEDMEIQLSGSEQILSDATTLSVDEAENLLRGFVADAFTKSATSFRIKEHKVKTLYIDNTESFSVTVKDTIPVYEFVTETDGREGYSVVVGDKRVEKVLVSVPAGSLSDTSFIEPLRLYFRDLPMLIRQDLSQYYAETQEKAILTKMTAETAYCFTSTNWGQGYPYNAKCPNLCPAGCVAIAVSQILAYHKVPSNLSWSSILAKTTVTSSSSATVIDQVSTLIHDVGVKLHTEYGAIESGAPSTYVVSTLSSYGLSCGGIIRFSLFDCQYSLRNSGPLILGAQSSGGGHMWVCDGWKRHIYDDATYYDYLNMNWGWDGSSNGFYLVEDPIKFSSGGHLFNSGFVMAYNIRK
ncbi:C10 family peptidase [Parabacteroides sp.]|uniref:C10 family peptidase n=1 Tax=Parabacteroides sp. TaxID=1869337 RepID=UPI00257C4C95|nr:C10 family peptidase [Parabacteroides sp.]